MLLSDYIYNEWVTKLVALSISPLIGFRESLDEKTKSNLVQIKGRFSVTSENLDLVKVSL